MAARYRYLAYGLTIVSQLQLPELGDHLDAEGNADLTIRLGEVARFDTDGGGMRDEFRWIDPQHFWMHVDGVAHFLVSDSRTITVMPDAGVEPSVVRAFLLGSACGALLVQRGFLVLHGNAIRIGDACLVCVGDSGAGKSTLAAGFLKRGYQVLADDVVAVDVDGCAIPGFPRIKLWQDAAEQLAISIDGRVRVLPDINKYNVPIAPFDQHVRLPIRWVYHLTKGDVENVGLAPINGLRRFRLLRDNTYRNEYLEGRAMHSDHLDQCSNLARRVHMVKVLRPEHGFALDTLIDALLADVTAVAG